MPWSVLPSSHSRAKNKVYTRPLGLNETSFYFDRIFNGTADIIWQYLVQVTDRAEGASIFSEENIKRAWRSGAYLHSNMGVTIVAVSQAELSLRPTRSLGFPPPPPGASNLQPPELQLELQLGTHLMQVGLSLRLMPSQSRARARHIPRLRRSLNMSQR